MKLSRPILAIREQIDEYLAALKWVSIRPWSVILYTVTERKVNEILKNEKLSVMHFHELRVKKGDIGILLDVLKSETTQENTDKIQHWTVVLSLSDLMSWIDSFEFCKTPIETLDHLRKSVLYIDMEDLSEAQISRAPSCIIKLDSLGFKIQWWGKYSDSIKGMLEWKIYFTRVEKEDIIRDFQASTRETMYRLQSLLWSP